MPITKPSKTLIISGIIIFLFLYVPLFIVILYSFNDSRINISWVGFSLHWYRVLFSDDQILAAVLNSLLIALIASVVSIIFGTFAGVALYYYKLPFLRFLIYTPIAAPELLIGVSLLLFYLLINFTLGIATIALAHIAFCTSFVAISVRTRMYNLDQSILDAARDLGASPIKTFILILIPMIMPGIIAGGLMAFTLSIDDFVITFFTAGPGSNTLPLVIYSMLRVGVTPEINALSTLIIIFTLIIATIFNKLSQKK